MSKIVDAVEDSLDKVSSPTSRAGSTIERVGKVCEKGVHPEVIALQMTKNSSNSYEYTEDDISAYKKIYQDTKTKVVITKAQASGLIENQKAEDQDVADVADVDNVDGCFVPAT